MVFHLCLFQVEQVENFLGVNKLLKHEEKEVSLAEIWLNSLASVVNS